MFWSLVIIEYIKRLVIVWKLKLDFIGDLYLWVEVVIKLDIGIVLVCKKRNLWMKGLEGYWYLYERVGVRKNNGVRFYGNYFVLNLEL